MASDRPAKRTRVGQSSYHDAIPMLDSYHVVNASEGISRTVKGKTQYIRRPESPEVVTGSWDAISSWEPPDDLEIALDADGAAYNAAVDELIMNNEVPVPVEKQKQKRSIVSVSCRAKHSIRLS